jgi:hypothetical protein
MKDTLAEKIRNEYRKIAKRQHARFGNHLGESNCAEAIASVLAKAVEDTKLSPSNALKMCQPFAKAEYGEYGLTPGTVYPILSKYVSDHWYRSNMEVKLTYIDR